MHHAGFGVLEILRFGVEGLGIPIQRPTQVI